MQKTEFEAEKKWYAVYTKFKAEKWVSEKLAMKNIEAFTPLVSKTKKYSKRIATHYYPLISCYVFVRLSPNEMIKVLQTEHVYDFVKFQNKIARIPDHEIDLLKRIVGEAIVSQEFVSNTHLGKQVEIISGNLTGIKGKLIDIHGKKEFVVELESIGYQLTIHIDPAFLMPANQQALAF